MARPTFDCLRPGLLTAACLLAAQLASGVSLSFNVNYWVTTANPELYSVNIENGMDPNVAQNREYKQNLANIAPGMVRYHSANQETSGSSTSWVDYFTQTWDTNKINGALGALGYTPKDRLICICKWPGWMNDNSTGRLKTTKYDQFAGFCSNLVYAVNQQMGYHVKYWEIFNEQDGAYGCDGATMATIFTNCAARMKQADPAIKIAGAAWTQPYQCGISSFLDRAGASLDGWTHHQYGGGDSGATPQTIYGWASGIASGCSSMRGTLNSKGLSGLPIWQDEYNVFWSWDLDPNGYMRTSPGMIFDALVIKQVAEQGNATGLFIWQDCDNTFGVIAGTGASSVLRPSGNLLMLYNKWGVGRILQTVSGDTSLVQGYAVLDAGGHVMLSVINRSTASQAVVINPLGYTPAITSVEQDVISNSGIARSIINWSDLVSPSGITIPFNSVVVFRINELTQTPCGGTTPTLPATLQAENFDNGGDGIAWHSATYFNGGWVYRTDVGVNIFPIPPTTNTFSVALAAGDWTEYTVNVPAGTYQINARAAGTGAFSVLLNGTSLASFSPSTGGTNTFTTLTSASVVLAGGSSQVLRVAATVAGFNLDSIQFVAVTPPMLAIAPQGNQLVISWDSAARFKLQYSASLISPAWTDEPTQPVTSGTLHTVTLTPAAAPRFYHLVSY